MLRTRSSAGARRPWRAAWWEGPTLAGAIDALPAVERGPPRPLRLPVADVIPGRGLNSFNFQFNLSRFRHKVYPTYPPLPPDTS